MAARKPRREGLSSTAQLLLFELRSIRQKDQQIFASNEYFARRLARSVRQIKRLLAELAAAKFISTKSKRLRTCKDGVTIFYSVREIILEVAPQDAVQPSTKTCHRSANCQPLRVSSFAKRESRQGISGSDVEHPMASHQCPSCSDSNVPAYVGDIDVPQGGYIKERNIFTNPPLPPIFLDEASQADRQCQIRAYLSKKGLSVAERELERAAMIDNDSVIVKWARLIEEKRRGSAIHSPLDLAIYRVFKANELVDSHELDLFRNDHGKNGEIQETDEEQQNEKRKKTQERLSQLGESFSINRAHSAGD